MIMLCAGTGQIMIARDEEEANYQESVDVWYGNLAASKKKTLSYIQFIFFMIT